MGTRHLIAVHVDGQYKVAQYGQWDGYPSGQGIDVLDFCRAMDRAAFAAKCRAAVEITSEEFQAAWAEAGATGDWVTMDVSERMKNLHPHLVRECSSDILNIVATSEPGIKLKLQPEFAADSLFCEWAYVIDLDKGTLEVFKGFNTTPLEPGERFAYLDKPDVEYHPVRLVHAFNLDSLPDEEAFLQACDPQEEEVENEEVA